MHLWWSALPVLSCRYNIRSVLVLVPINTCNPHDEYNIFTGSTETPHAIYTNSEGEGVIQCGTVKLGSGGLFN